MSPAEMGRLATSSTPASWLGDGPCIRNAFRETAVHGLNAELLSSAASERREPANPGFPARPIRRARGFVRSSVAMDVALWLRIFGRLDADDLVRASAVCREWRDVCDDDFLWTELTRRDARDARRARQMGGDSRRAYFCNEAWRCGAFIRRPDPVLSARASPWRSRVLGKSRLGDRRRPPLDNTARRGRRRAIVPPIHRAETRVPHKRFDDRRVPGFLPSRRRGRLRRRPRTHPHHPLPSVRRACVARYDGRVTTRVPRAPRRGRSGDNSHVDA